MNKYKYSLFHISLDSTMRIVGSTNKHALDEVILE